MNPSEAFLIAASIGVVWISLLIAPIVALAYISSRKTPQTQKKALIASAVVFFVILLFSCVGVRFTSSFANIVLSCFAYLAYCNLVVCCRRIPCKPQRLIAIGIAGLPIVFGYFLATIGFLGLGFIVLDFSTAPVHTEKVGNSLECRITYWGMAASDSGYAVHLYRRWPIPFIERELIKMVINETAGEGPASCAEVLARYEGR